MLLPEGRNLVEKIKRFITMKDNKGIMLLNKDTEEYFNVSTPLGGVPELQAKSQEMICGVSRIPVVKYLGIQPAGLNASSEGELTVWGDYIRAQQEFFFRPHLQTVIAGLFGDRAWACNPGADYALTKVAATLWI
jgi:uncharacterized protein